VSGPSSRRKGLRGEQEVAREMRAAGLEVRNLEGSGDHLTATAGGRQLHVETKRQERLQLPMWLRQAADEAPRGAVPVVVFRQSRGQWYACLPLGSLLEIVGTDDA